MSQDRGQLPLASCSLSLVGKFGSFTSQVVLGSSGSSIVSGRGDVDAVEGTVGSDPVEPRPAGANVGMGLSRH